MTLLVPGHHLRSHRLSQRAQRSRETRVEVWDDNNVRLRTFISGWNLTLDDGCFSK